MYCGSSGGYDLSGHLEDAAAGRLESDLADLKSAYGKTMDEYDAAADKLPRYYQTAKNQAAAQSAMAQKNFDERAAASGLNSGAGGQAALDAQATEDAGTVLLSWHFYKNVSISKQTDGFQNIMDKLCGEGKRSRRQGERQGDGVIVSPDEHLN